MTQQLKLVVGDVHHKPTNLETGLKFYDFVEGLTERNKDIGKVILLGDVYDTKAIVRAEVQNFMLHQMDRLNNVFWDIIVGNHDMISEKHGGPNGLLPLTLLEHVSLTQRLSTGTSPSGERSIHLPYMHEQENFIKALKEAVAHNGGHKYFSAVFCHQGFTGFDYGNGVIEEHGTDFKEAVKIVPNAVFYVGHFHKWQESERLIYVGSPYSHSWGEKNQAKFVLLLDEKNKIVEKIQTDTIFPAHRELHYDAIDDSWIRQPVKAQDYVRVIVKCKKADVKKFDRLWATEQLGVDAQVMHDFVDGGMTARLDETAGTEKTFEHFMEARGFQSAKKLGHEILERASQ